VEIREYNKRSGGHRHEGFLIAAGPDFAATGELAIADLTDVAPTVLALFGLPVPDYMDGRPITAALAPPPATAAHY
jgi:predicted AlkP superfamily phosphohydrolase/phosphomutase